MSTKLPPQNLACPNPAGCPVAVKQLEDLAIAGGTPTAAISKSSSWCRVYDARDGYMEPNPGYGDTRFAPFDSLRTNKRVPTLYLAEDLEAALLETSLHTVPVNGHRSISEELLLGKLHARVVAHEDLVLADFRDEQLDLLGLSRTSISSSPAEHYPCTRRVARQIHGSSPVQGIIWHSRQAELTGKGPKEVIVLFADRVTTERDSWKLWSSRESAGAVIEGSGRLQLDRLAEGLRIAIETSTELD